MWKLCGNPAICKIQSDNISQLDPCTWDRMSCVGVLEHNSDWMRHLYLSYWISYDRDNNNNNNNNNSNNKVLHWLREAFEDR